MALFPIEFLSGLSNRKQVMLKSRLFDKNIFEKVVDITTSVAVQKIELS
jgi:hypothetical protein